MGLYGSPDLSKKYGDVKKKRRLKFSLLSIVLVVIYLIIVVTNDNKLILTASYVGVLSMAFFVINFIKMLIKLIKKQKVNSEVIKLLICITLFIISGIFI